MRVITDHRSYLLGDRSDTISVFALDEPGEGGACHSYEVLVRNEACPQDTTGVVGVQFQDGPIGEYGLNGATHESLLAIVIDRLKSFQAGPYSCRENALALTALQEAMHWLHHRTRERMLRGVEGTHEK